MGKEDCVLPCREVIEARKDIAAICLKLELTNKHHREALSLARHEMERRLESMNEFRDQLEKQAGTFATKTEENLKHSTLEDRVRAVERVQYVRAGSTRWSDHIITVLIGLAVVIAVWLLKTAGN